MRTLALLFFFIAVPLARGNFQPSREVDFWRGTGADLDFAGQFISNDICYKSEELLSSCREAFEQAAYMLDRNGFMDLRKATMLGTKQDFNAGLARVSELASAPGARYPLEMVIGSMLNEQLRRFDSHAGIQPGEMLNARYAGSAQETVGIGMEEEINSAGVYIRRVYPYTPAESAGLMVNDRLVAVNGRPVAGGVKAVAALKQLAQAPGQTVTLLIERAGQRHEVPVVVAPLVLRNVNVSYEQFDSGTFAVVSLRVFAQGVCAETENKLAFARDKVKGVILDLRGNLGGALDEAACILSLFSRNTRLVERRAIGRLLPAEFPLNLSIRTEGWQEWKRLSAPPLENMPLTVLVNATSASASEMLAAALQDQNRAWLVGEVTFGKGSTQAVVGIASRPRLRLIYTGSRYYRPGGQPIQLTGVTPNFITPFESNASPEERRFPREAEFYGTTLNRETTAATWAESRPKEVQAITKCIHKDKLHQRVATTHFKKYGYEDNQLTTALAIHLCTK